MTYEDALAYIASLEPRGWRLGLDRMAEFARRVGLDDALGGAPGPKFIHVAGTNGKGSTTANLQSIMVECGFRTGAFFSPFVVDPRERVQFGREMISREELAEEAANLVATAEDLTDTEFGGVTEFEFKTALGFAYWQRKRCEWVALEVGLGGRLDATNIVRPEATIIVSISLDHTNILGSTYRDIAREKAGIIKPGVPIIVGELPGDALEEIEAIAESRSTPLWLYGREIRRENQSVVTPNRRFPVAVPGLGGGKQEVNAALAVAALDAAGAWEGMDERAVDLAVRLGCQRAWIPGRFQIKSIMGRTVVFDGAHNEEAARVLSQSLSAAFPGRPIRMVTNMVSGHELEPFYEPLAAGTSSVYIVPISIHRARDPQETAGRLRRTFRDVRAFESVAAGLSMALQDSTADEIVLVTGSFYLVGEALNLTGQPRNEHLHKEN